MSDSFVTPWTVARQAPLSMGLPRQEYWSGLPFPSPGDLPNPGFEPGSPACQADSLPTELRGKLQNTLLICLAALSLSCCTWDTEQARSVAVACTFSCSAASGILVP